MSFGRAGVLAWTLFVTFLAIALTLVGLVASGRGRDDLFILLALGYPLVGAVVASRPPANAVGWSLLAIGGPSAQILRYRRAARLERQQIKWLALAGVIAATTFALGLAALTVVDESVVFAAMMTSVVALPVAAGVAVLRYRLYDVHVVINRALVHGALTATLAGAYVGGVLLLQLALGGVIEGNGLAVAGSTLAVAALFQPARADPVRDRSALLPPPLQRGAHA